jgi:hypothetical protein
MEVKVGSLTFVAMIKFWLSLFFCIISIQLFSQESSISGYVCDKDNKGRMAFVNIRNITTGMQVYDNFKGEFKIIAKAGDCLILSKADYKADTLTIKNNEPVAIYMSRTSILLKEVSIHSSSLNPEKQLDATKNDFTKIYGSLGYRDFLVTPSTGGVGISIDAIWNAFSRSGRNAEKLRETIESDYEQNVIDFRFNKSLVAKLTGLKDEKLSSFMSKYRPKFYTATSTNDYEFASIIKSNYQSFLVDSSAYYLPPLTANTTKF